MQSTSYEVIPPKDKLVAFVRRIAILYSMWMVIQIILIPERCAGWMNIEFPIKILFGSTFGGSWFYSALVIATLIIFLLRKNSLLTLSVSMTAYLTFVLGKCGVPVFCIIYDKYAELLSPMFLSWPYALLWTFTGFCMASRYGLKKIVGVSLFLSLFLVPLNFIYGNCVSWLLRYVCVVMIGFCCCRYNCRMKLPYRWLRKTSTLVFMIHFYFVYLIPEQGYLLGFLSVKFIKVLLFSILLSSVIIEMAKINKMKFFKYLY